MPPPAAAGTGAPPPLLPGPPRGRVAARRPRFHRRPELLRAACVPTAAECWGWLLSAAPLGALLALASLSAGLGREWEVLARDRRWDERDLCCRPRALFPPPPALLAPLRSSLSYWDTRSAFSLASLLSSAGLF